MYLFGEYLQLEHIFQYNSEYDCVESIYNWTLTINQLIDADKTLHELSVKHNVFIHLVDLTNCKNQISDTDLYKHADNLKSRWPRSMKVAMVVSKEIESDVHFYETVCVNRGWNVKIFLNRNAALEWLID